MKWLILSILLIAGLCQAAVPAQAQRHRAELTRNARAVWGLDAPIATFAAQIYQESGWHSDAKSAYAGGLAQFTPATAEWISGAYPKDLGENQPFNPSWAMRALITYDRHLWDRMAGRTSCDRMAFTLAGYNGGAGWIYRDKALAKSKGGDPLVWFGQVERCNAGRAPAMFAENRGYPRAILLKWQPLYAGWGGGVTCAT